MAVLPPLTALGGTAPPSPGPQDSWQEGEVPSTSTWAQLHHHHRYHHPHHQLYHQHHNQQHNHQHHYW